MDLCNWGTRNAKDYGLFWFFFFFFFFFWSLISSFNFRHSSLITYHLEYPNFLIPTRLAIVFISHHSIISTVLWDPHIDPKKTFLSFFFFLDSYIFLCLPWTHLCFSFGLFLSKQSKNLHTSLTRIASIDGISPHCQNSINWQSTLFEGISPQLIRIVHCQTK